MKAILLVSSLILGENDGYAMAEHSQEFNNLAACTNAVQIRTDYCCELNVGDAIMVSNDISIIKNVIYAPTMRSPKKLPFGDDSPYRSVLAALQLINRFNRDCPDEVKIRSVILPMMGSNTGEVPYPNVLCQMIRAIQRYSNPKPIEDLFQDGQDTDAFMKVIWNNQFT